KTHIHGDQYSLAATFFELRTGRRLYRDTGLPALMRGHLHEIPSLDPLGQEEQRVLLKALSKNPEERYPDCLSFVHALGRGVAREMPAESVALPATPGSPTATDSGMHTIVPGQGAREVFTPPSAPVADDDTPEVKKAWAPPSAPEPAALSAHGGASLIGRVLA